MTIKNLHEEIIPNESTEKSCSLDRLRNFDINKIKNLFSRLIKSRNIKEVWSKQSMTKSMR